MGFLSFLSGRTPQELEKRGDAFVEAGEYGAAKLEFEKATDKLSKKSVGKPGDLKRVERKLVQCRESMALEHKKTAEDLMETGYWDEADERLQLALELTNDGELRQDIESLQEQIKDEISEAARKEFADVYREPEEDHEDRDEPDEEETFAALCSGLSGEERSAYYGYGEAFQSGYVALNRGDFEQAASDLSRALEEHPDGEGYIHLELATAYLNLGRRDEAYELLDDFLGQHPGSLKGHAVMCEILWEQKSFDEALERLNACPRDGVDPVAHLLLWGETLFQAGRYEEAENLFLGFTQSRGWDENVVRALAGVYEAAGSPEKARDLYLEILSNCRSCRRAPDPFIKRRLADIGYDAGDYGVGTLELYLSLAQEDPENRREYYGRVSRIYASMGNEEEAVRFRAFATEPGEEE